MSTSPTIVLIEDHAALRAGLKLLLEREGVLVIGTAGNAAAGHAVIRELEPDVAVVDIDLAGESGIDLMQRLLAEDSERRVVLYTGSGDYTSLKRGLDGGARGYALKNGATDELVEAITAVAAGDTYVDPRLQAGLLSRDTGSATMRKLSRREREIMGLLAQGMTGEGVAAELVLSTETVKTHIRNAMGKLDASTRVHAVAIALREGLIPSSSAARW